MKARKDKKRIIVYGIMDTPSNYFHWQQTYTKLNDARWVRRNNQSPPLRTSAIVKIEVVG